MTDDEIIKALDYCKRSVGAILCSSNCPMYNECESEDPMEDICGLALDLINRQKAEIERLEKDLMKCKLEKEMLYHVGTEIKTVAIKEFAERLKEKIRSDDDCEYHCFDCCYECRDYVQAVDNLVKEMTEVQDNDR